MKWISGKIPIPSLVNAAMILLQIFLLGVAAVALAQPNLPTTDPDRVLPTIVSHVAEQEQSSDTVSPRRQDSTRRVSPDVSDRTREPPRRLSPDVSDRTREPPRRLSPDVSDRTREPPRRLNPAVPNSTREPPRRIGPTLSDTFRSGVLALQQGNMSEAITWFNKAANNNDLHAQMFLASLYLDGYGVTKNFSMAIKWLARAADHERQSAIELLKTLVWDAILNNNIQLLSEILPLIKNLTVVRGLCDKNGNWSPLMVAIDANNVEAVRLLAKFHPNWLNQAEKKEGITPLMLAVFKSNKPMVQVLLDLGADKTQRIDDTELDAALIARLKKDSEIYDILK